ncbi:addiction module antitoxin [Thermosynechococcaceae cyanobacterium BACA0444]|uniref:Addiction module antitoxin n=1 Tax=Pseudocalidococcus azoricus BACA0444 TaxID=2918990 RepID=A0AAE4FRM4_9CYAN|nr:hypothetical protein [Pseudocalidococcus azoricus]MDS3860272.1 addiction module antitoxin [Pseudocalidococcus azoricus BACA0444]
MQKELKITLDEEIYNKLSCLVGTETISQLIENLIRPQIMDVDLDEGYRQMAADQEREAEALAWAEATIGDI